MRCIVCDAEKASYRCRTCRSAYCSSACYKKHRMSKEEAIASNPQAHSAPQKEKEGSNAQGNSGDDKDTHHNSSESTLHYLCEVIVAAQQPEKEREEKRQRTEAEADVFSDISREKATTSGSRSRPGETATPSPPPQDNKDLVKQNTTQATDKKNSSEVSAPGEAPSSPAVTADEAGNSDDKANKAQQQQQSAPPPSSSTSAPPPLPQDEEVAADADAVYILQERHLSALANDPGVRSALRSPSLQRLIRTIDESRSRLDALDAAQYNNADFKQFCNEVMRAIARAEGR